MNNINPNLWGPHGWKFLHYVTMAYPNNPTETDKQKIKDFFMTCKNILPCEKCRTHFQMNLNKYPLNCKILENKINLVDWLRKIHNEVNIRKNKPIYTLEQVLKEYKNHNNCYTEYITIYLFLLIFIIIIIYAIFRK